MMTFASQMVNQYWAMFASHTNSWAMVLQKLKQNTLFCLSGDIWEIEGSITVMRYFCILLEQQQPLSCTFEKNPWMEVQESTRKYKVFA